MLGWFFSKVFGWSLAKWHVCSVPCLAKISRSRCIYCVLLDGVSKDLRCCLHLYRLRCTFCCNSSTSSTPITSWTPQEVLGWRRLRVKRRYSTKKHIQKKNMTTISSPPWFLFWKWKPTNFQLLTILACVSSCSGPWSQDGFEQPYKHARTNNIPNIYASLVTKTTLSQP